MAQLSELQLAAILEEIAGAMRVDAPATDALRRLGERRLGGVARASRKILGRLESGETLDQAIRISNSPIILQASAAVEACQRSGNSTLLSRLASQLRTRHENLRFARLSWLYPILLVAIAYAIATLVMAPMVRENQAKGFYWSPWIVAASEWLKDNWWMPPVIFAGVLFVVAFWFFRRRKLSRPLRQLLFCQTLADQIDANIPEDEAIRAALLMSGTESNTTDTLNLESSVVDDMTSVASLDIPNLSGVSVQELVIAKLRYATAVHSERARRHEFVWGRLVPRLTMVLIGAGLTFSYAWWVIRPIYQQVAVW